ncbi:hypothetical protein [Curtobacterium luteum]|uniref:Uncharacterized protein n=1 Tax=Curtobacterium luteum TaxID=33881 RepID=A0A175RXL4_9MICO|nr:hypothetical protein [Curtobacterium luteum]KTR08277.1 hypothetical protein NS184_06120 [Curtobacterium luteum]
MGNKVRMPNRSETPKRVQDLEDDLKRFVASVARSFQKSADSVYQRVLDAVQAMFWTRDQSDARFAYKSHTHDAGDITSGTVTRPVNTSSVQADQHLGGTYTGTTASFSGGVSGSNGSFSTGINSPGARNNQVTTGYVAAYLDVNGNLGFAPSTRASKDIGSEYAVDMTKFLAQKLYNWQYKNGGMVGIGPIADDLEAAGLTEFLTYSMDGKLQGLRYESLTMGLWSAYVQSRTSTLAEFNKRMVQTYSMSSMTALGINAEKTYDVVWPKEFADTNYAVTASVTSAGAVLGALCALVPGSKTTKGCKVSVRSLGIALLANNTLTVEAIHV